MAAIADPAEHNPWWKDPSKIQSDPNIASFEESTFKWRPRIAHTILWDEDIIYSMRGPRQVGKTTLMKLKIRELLDVASPSRRVFYLPCDMLQGQEQLYTMLRDYLQSVRRLSKDRLYIFVDEISSVKNWQQAVKALYDSGSLKNCTVLLAGSHSLDLLKGTENLAGRRGKIEKLPHGNPDRILLPMKFSEYAETRNAELKQVLRRLSLTSLQRRVGLLESLSGGTIPREFYELEPFLSDVNGLLDDYLITGGIPKAVNSYVTQGTISEGVYLQYVELIVRDLVRWDARESFVKQIVRRMVECLSTQVSWNSLKDGTEVKTHDTIAQYVELLRNSFVINVLYHLREDTGEPFYEKNKKVYFHDPFVFHSLRAWVQGGDPFDGARTFLRTAENKSALLEAVTCDHLIRFLFNISPSIKFDYTNQLFYWVSSKQREVDFVMKTKNRMIPLELKYQEKIRGSDLYGLIDFVKGGKADKGLMLTRNSLSEGRTAVQLPVALFLLLP